MTNKKMKFDHLNKLYMHQLESVLENEVKILRAFEMQTVHLILVARSDLVIDKKKEPAEFHVLPDHRIKMIES